jgi:hypothetical protein
VECCAGAKFRLDIAVVHSTDGFIGGCHSWAVAILRSGQLREGEGCHYESMPKHFVKPKQRVFHTLLDTKRLHFGTITRVTVVSGQLQLSIPVALRPSLFDFGTTSLRLLAEG